LAFCLDPDADRLALIDETGACLSEELTLALAVQFRLAQKVGPVVVNMSTSRVVEDVCRQCGAPFQRSAVGEANVVAGMRAAGAVIGGEGNGGVIDPRIGWVRDPFVGMAFVLNQMAATGRRLSQLAAALPRYVIVKDKLPLARENLPAALAALERRWPDAVANRIDGLRLDWSDRWLHLRGSNTEPIARLIAEAPSEREANELIAAAKAVLGEG
jgi:phosphomannomutase